MLTTKPNRFVAEVHDRMPVILRPNIHWDFGGGARLHKRSARRKGFPRRESHRVDRNTRKAPKV